MISTYCTVAEVTTYAAANGETAWMALVQTDLSGAINNASGYSSGSKSIAVDGFGDDVNPISSGAVFTIASDSTNTEYTVISTKFNEGTTEINFTPGLAENVADNDVVTFSSSEATQFQTRCVAQACRDIVRYLKQINWDSTLWLDDNDDLKTANILQAIENAKNLENRDRAQAIGAITPGSFSDGAVSIEQPSGAILCDDARFYVDKALEEYKEARVKITGRSIGR